VEYIFDEVEDDPPGDQQDDPPPPASQPALPAGTIGGGRLVPPGEVN